MYHKTETRNGITAEQREELVNRVEVLDNFKGLVLAADGDFATISDVASFFDIATTSIRHALSAGPFAKEFKRDGAFKLTIEEARNRGWLEGNHIVFGNGEYSELLYAWGMWILPKRAILRLAMVLPHSQVAQKIRDVLLDTADAHPDQIAEQIDEETVLIARVLQAKSDDEMAEQWGK